MRHMNTQFRLALMLACLPSVARAELPTIDGVFSDWGEQYSVASDEQGDAIASFDLSKVSAVTNGSELYVHFDIGSEINLQSGIESDGTLRLEIALPRRQELTIDFRKRTAILSADPSQSIPWSELGFACLPTFASERYELRLDLQMFNVQPDDRIQLNFSGSDQLDQAVSIVLQKRHPRSLKSTFAKSDTSNFRIANLNTLRQGMSNNDRSGSIKRLLAAAKADIFCFQEEWDETAFRKAAAQIVPTEGQVNLHWSNGCGIASSLPLEPIAMELDRCAAAIIELPNSKPLVVISVHLKCCGFTGSREDLARVQQAKQLAAGIQKIRNREASRELAGAGVVVIGDYNLVGSRKPLDILETAGLSELLLLGVDKRAAFTWRGLRKEESFWPGRLDLVTYDNATLRPAGGFLIDTSSLSKKSLRDLRLLAHDSEASDHLMMVADFHVRSVNPSQ